MLLDYVPEEARAEIRAIHDELDADLDFRWASTWTRLCAAILVWTVRQIMAGRRNT